MFLTAIAIAAIQQAAQPPSPAAAQKTTSSVSLPTNPPVFPIGARPELHQLARSIEDLLAKGDTAQAAKLADNLPKPNFTIGWDESGLPENYRSVVENMRDFAMQAWQRIPHLSIKLADTPTGGDVNISFTKELPKDAAGLPEASTITFGINPRVTAVIGLNRGAPPQSIIPGDAFMEIGHAIGAYLGNADDSLPGSCMYRNNLPGLRVYGPNRSSWVVAGRNLDASDAIRVLVKANKPLGLSDAQMGVTPTKIELGPVRQGIKIPLDFTVTNSGKAKLNYSLVPDCGCFSKTQPGSLATGEKAVVRTLVDTTSYVGEIHKLLVLYTNDPNTPVQEIPVSFTATPPCRLYRPQGENVILPVPNNTFDILLTVPAGSKLKPSQYEWSGTHDSVTMEPWTGSAADPDLNEGSKPRQGYIFHVKLSDKAISGRSSATLHVVTDDALIPDFTYTVFMQKGIVALPEEVFLGELSTVNRGTFIVSRRGKPFNITEVDTGTKCLKATVTPVAGGAEYRVDVIYDGNGPRGDFAAQIKIKTDDPAQPLLQVMMRGTIT
jgi:hypothetical protein